MANFGAHGGYPKWTDAEIALLRELFPRTPWPELAAAFPGRSRQAVQQMAKATLKLKREINRREKWTSDETIILRRLYPTVSDDELRDAFPRHTFLAIQRQASALKIMRPRMEARHHGRFVHPIIVHLHEERKKQHLNRVQLSKKIGYTHGAILKWELGHTKPDFVMLCDWAQALGLEIIVRKQLEAPESIVIPYPEKRRLMAGRA